MSHISIQSENGLCVNVGIRQHQLTLDVPAEKGGADAGPTPVELLAAALGACMTMHAVMYCQSARLPHEGFGVEVDFQMAKDPLRIGSLNVEIMLPPDFPEARMEAVQRAMQQCPVKNTLKESTIIDVKLRTSATAQLETADSCAAGI